MGVRIEPLQDRKPARAAVDRQGAGAAWWKLELSFRARRLSGRSRERFYHDLAELLGAGMDTRNALEILAGAHGRTPIGAAARELGHRLVEGASLHAAMQQQGAFSELEAFSVRIGEESGDLAGIMAELHGHYAQMNALRRKIVTAISYPAFVTAISFAVIAFMLAVVVPMFADVFKRFGRELPPLTRSVMYASKHGDLLLITIVLLVVLVLVLQALRKRLPIVDHMSTRVTYALPFIGRLVREGHTARTCRSIGMLLGADVPLTETLLLAADMSGSPLFKEGLRASSASVVRGMPLHQALEETRLFDASAIALVKVGEEVNRLDRMFTRLAERSQTALEQRAAVMTSILEPALILVVAVFVGIVLVAMYLPLFKLSTTLG